MKLKQLLAAALLVCSSGAWAQTDVTSTYIVNPSFESDGAKTKSNGALEMTGWTQSDPTSSFNNTGFYNASTNLPTQGTVTVTPSDGSYLLFFRKGWAQSTYTFTTTETKNLPVGVYTLSVDYKMVEGYDNTQNNNTSVTIAAKSGETTLGSAEGKTKTNVSGGNAYTYLNTASWSTVTANFTIEAVTEVNFVISLKTGGQRRSDFVIDNVRLTWTDPLEAAKNRLQDAIDKATTYNSTLNNASLTEAISTATSTKSSATTEAELDEAITTLNAAVVAAVAETNEETTVSTALFVANNSFETGDFTGWEKYNANDTRIAKNETGTYFTNDGDGDYLFNTWGGSAAKYIKQTLTNLPEGYYTVTALVASDAGNKITLYAGESTKEVEASSSGKEYFVAGTTPKIYVEANGSLEIGATSTAWYKADNFRLTHYTVAAGAKEALAEAITSANAIDKTTNVGEGTFQKPTSAKNTLVSAIETAEGIYNDPAGDYKAAASDLAAAVAAWNNVVLNAPNVAKRYAVTMHDDGQDWDGNAITFIANGRNGEGNYNVKYFAATNANLCQALKFTAVEGKTNTYYISAVNTNGTEQYLTSRTLAYGDGTVNDQIRTTDDAAKAVEISVKTADGGFKLFNQTGTEIARNGSNPDNGLFPNGNVGSYFTIDEAEQASVPGSIAAGQYATRIFPFIPVLPSGIKVYSCAEVDGSSLTLAEESTTAANTPYILFNTTESPVDISLSGWGTAADASYQAGLLTGVYATTAVPTDSYVLQTLNEKQAFYIVDAKAPVDAPAYRAYLTVSSGNVKAFFFNDIATGINAVMNEIAAGNIFDLSGRKVAKMQKGQTYIIGNKKVNVK